MRQSRKFARWPQVRGRRWRIKPVASVSNRFIAGWTGGRDGGGDDVAIRELEGANLGDHKQ